MNKKILKSFQIHIETLITCFRIIISNFLTDFEVDNIKIHPEMIYI